MLNQFYTKLNHNGRTINDLGGLGQKREKKIYRPPLREKNSTTRKTYQPVVQEKKIQHELSARDPPDH